MTSPRLIARLSEGVQRKRLMDPVLANRPALVLISAPSGYGKTVLAAQVAVSGAFEKLVWISGTGASNSVQDALVEVIEHLDPHAQGGETQSLPDTCHTCCEALAALPDDRTLLVVFDDVSWAADADSRQLVEDVFSEAPIGSTTLVTTRASLSDSSSSIRSWTILTDQLLLTDDEIGEAWQLLACRAIEPSKVRDVAAASGRHAALVSLMARHAALGSPHAASAECGASVSSLVQSLSLQLSPSDRGLLDYAAVLGQGSIEELRQVSQSVEAGRALPRIAAAIPLVSVSGAVARHGFAVHSLVSEVLRSVSSLAQADPDGLWRVVDCLAAAGASARAMEAANESGLIDLMAHGVRLFGAHLLKGASWEAVRDALDLLPAAMVADDPQLLLARAEVAWVQNDRMGAIRQATLAIRLGELSGEGAVPSNARSLLAGMRMSVADYAGAVSDVAPYLDRIDHQDADDMADVLYAAIPAYAFLGDRAGLERCKAAAINVISTARATCSRLARLEMAMGIVSDIVDGDSPTSAMFLSRATARTDIPQHWRALALGNLAAAQVETGDLAGARQTRMDAVMIGSRYSTPLDRCLLNLVEAAADALDGTTEHVEDIIDCVISACEAEGETFSLATTCAIGAQIAVALGNVRYATGLSEKGLKASAQIGSPVLLWLAELVQAQTLMASGETEEARSIAERVLPRVEGIGAAGHILRSRLVLAEAALRDGDLSAAVIHLSSVRKHIVEKSPALTVGSFLRASPALFGPLVLDIGVDQMPMSVLRLMHGRYGTEILQVASTVLTSAEMKRLSERMSQFCDLSSDEERPKPEPAVCRVRLFGGLEVVTPKGAVADRDWGKRKARLLFAMLVARSGTDVPRGELIEHLWPEMDEDRALNNFYVVWSAMKRAISPESVREAPCPFVEHVHGVCRVVPGRVVTDLDQFRTHLSDSRRARAQGDTSSELSSILAAAEIYRGELLPGDVYDDWFGPLRERYRHDFEDAMLRAAQLMSDGGEPHEALSVLRRALSHDPWREDLYQATLRTQITAGQRSAAIDTYMSCRNRLVEDLGIDPSRETTLLYEQVLGMEQ